MLRLLSDYEMEVTSNMIEVDELISKAGPGRLRCISPVTRTHAGRSDSLQSQACPNIESNDHWTPLQLAAYH
jgi:hypothetical protein